MRITSLPKNTIFVFGSNEAGHHGAGAAKDAMDYFGAEYGVGFGLCGQSYAIPTKDFKIDKLPLDIIKDYVDQFMDFAEEHPELTFRLTRIGCGLAGYTGADIGPMFKGAPNNVQIPEEFVYWIEEQ